MTGNRRLAAFQAGGSREQQDDPKGRRREDRDADEEIEDVHVDEEEIEKK